MSYKVTEDDIFNIEQDLPHSLRSAANTEREIIEACWRHHPGIKALREELAEARQTIEDVACGTQMECAICGEYKPCLCDKPLPHG